MNRRKIIVLTGSRGFPAEWAPPPDAVAFRVAHRALPLSMVQQILAQALDFDEVIAIGGGTVMDAAKALISLHQASSTTRLQLIPTTFGTGAEVTTFATVYADDGSKLSLTLPEQIRPHVLYIPQLLHSLPEDEVQAGICDAFAHCFESLWARDATDESMDYAIAGLRIIRPIISFHSRIQLRECAEQLQAFGRSAGQAIAISRTTAAHAFSYELTQRFHIPHGYAVATFLPALHAACMQHQSIDSELALRLQLQSEALGLGGVDEVALFLRYFVHAMVPGFIQKSIQECLRAGRRKPPCPLRSANFPLASDQNFVAKIDHSILNPVRLSSSNRSVVPGMAWEAAHHRSQWTLRS